jgi:hypothetical protein
VRIWDCQRFKLTANARSQLSYPMRGRVTSCAVLDSSHSVVAGNDAGAVHVFKVEYVSKQEENAANRYAGLSLVKNFDEVNEGAILGVRIHMRIAALSPVPPVTWLTVPPALSSLLVVQVNHFNTLTESMLLYGTMRGHIHGFDLRCKSESFQFVVDPAMGLLSAMAVGPTPYCLVAGTTRGFVLLWDLRFQIPVQIWRHNARSRIVSIITQEYSNILPPNRSGRMPGGPSVGSAGGVGVSGGGAGGGAGGKHSLIGPLIFVAAEGTNEICAFDVYTGECRIVFRVLSTVRGGGASVDGAITKAAAGAGAGAAAAAPGAPAAPAAASGAAAGGKSVNRQATLTSLNAAASAAASASAGATSSSLTADDIKASKVSPLSLPSLRSYLRTEDGLPVLDEQFVREFTTVRATRRGGIIICIRRLLLFIGCPLCVVLCCAVFWCSRLRRFCRARSVKTICCLSRVRPPSPVSCAVARALW